MIKKNNIWNLHLPFPWSIHARMFILCILGSVLFWFIAGNGSFKFFFLISFLIMFINVEIFFWISRSLFSSFKAENQKAFIWQVIGRVLVFFFMILIVGTLVASTVVTLFQLQWRENLQAALEHLFMYEIKGIVISFLIGSVLATLLFFIIMWLEMMKMVYHIREQMLVYQSETLKNQLNPHFLFNSLNTLSSLITVQPEKAEQFTLKLADIYRYILENRDNETVTLNEEIEFVKDYFFLQKIRDEDKIDLHFEIEDENCKIIPVSLQLLVENAFKHNASTREKPLVVTVVQKGYSVEVRNNLQPRKLISESSGLGLENLSKRINIHTGKSMEVKQTADEFVVKMPLLCKQ